MIDNDTASLDPMLEMFIFETVQLIEQLEELLLEVEKGGCLTREAVNEVFRIMHTIKGSSAMMACDEISRLAHALEDLFDSFRHQHQSAVNCVSLNDHVLQSIDFIKSEVSKIENGQESDGKADALIERIGRFRETLLSRAEAAVHIPAGEAAVCLADRAAGPAPDLQAAQPLRPAQRYAIRLFFEDGCQMENLRAFTIIHGLESRAAALEYRPADIGENEKSADLIRESGFWIYLISHEDADSLMADLRQTMFLERLELETVDRFPEGILEAFASAGTDSAAAAIVAANTAPAAFAGALALPDESAAFTGAPALPSESAAIAGVSAFPGESAAENALRQLSGKQQSLISVSIHKLDQLMDLVGELVISEAMVTKNPDLAGLQLPQFEKAARQLHKLTNELQDIVMSIRMVPIAGTFHKMQRLVRDMTRKLEKDVTLTFAGETTEVDKSVSDSLADPLMHLIRNALDHGIESPAERMAAGKSAQGSLSLEARSAGGDVWITLKDDGRGLDRARILQKARERHLLTRPENEYSDKEAFAFILLPGFSTRDTVSEYSGRGVGMDVVRENISRAGGMLSIDSVTGAGTTITIRLPLTLAIIDGMQIAVGASSYIIPTAAIRESFRAAGDQLVTDLDGNEMLMYRGAGCNVIRLHRRFGVAAAVTEPEQGIMIAVEDDGQTCCLFVDRLIGEQQVVVKPLPSYIQKARGLAGCTILGNGSISLILDIGSLIRG